MAKDTHVSDYDYNDTCTHENIKCIMSKYEKMNYDKCWNLHEVAQINQLYCYGWGNWGLLGVRGHCGNSNICY